MRALDESRAELAFKGLRVEAFSSMCYFSEFRV